MMKERSLPPLLHIHSNHNNSNHNHNNFYNNNSRTVCSLRRSQRVRPKFWALITVPLGI